MREIKFRKAIPPDTLKDETGKLNKWEVKVIEGDIARHYPIGMLNNEFHMQFTGLKDKNGKEIYEGDILESEYTKSHYQVVWDDKLLQWMVSDCVMLWAFSRPEVIGNIYENPDLLTSDKWYMEEEPTNIPKKMPHGPDAVCADPECPMCELLEGMSKPPESL